MAEKKGSADKVLPFITTVANDIYEKVNRITDSFEKMDSMLNTMSETFQENLKKLSDNITSMLEETQMNRDLALEAFSDSMNAMLKQITQIQEESLTTKKGSKMKAILSKLEEISNKVFDKYWDLQVMSTVSNLHSLVDVLKGNTTIINIQSPTPVPMQPVPQKIISPEPFMTAAPIKSEPTTAAEEEPTKGPKFKDGRKVKTHDDRLKEMERKKKLFGKY